jgi:hypothetical protein
MRKQFYRKALSSQGVYCAVGIKDGHPDQQYADTLDQLDTLIQAFISQGANVYVAMSSFKGHSRKAADAMYCRSLFIDLDVGEDLRKYQSKDEAKLALNDFLTSSELPPPIVVDSGTGLHAYWCFNEDVPSNEWRVYATKFKAYCISQGLRIDPVVTADAARILRCPYTFNFKTTPPSPTVIETPDDEWYTYDFDAFKEFLGADIDTPDQTAIFAKVEKGLDDDTKALLKLNNIETSFALIARRSLEGKGCNQIKYVLEHAAALPEPVWHSGLSIARACVDGDEAIHLMSQDDPRYDADLTIKKANETVGKPHGCEIFETRNPGGCNGCPYKGKITNPLYFGRQLREADAEEDSVRLIEDSEAIHAVLKFPDFMYPYQRGADGGVYCVQSDDKDTEGPLLIWQYDIYPVKRMYGHTEGECLLMRHIMPHDDVREFLLPMSSVYSPEEIKKRFSTHGVFFKPKLAPLVTDYIIKWATYMVGKKMAEQMAKQMGWTQDNKGFIIGETEYRHDGKQSPAALSYFLRDIKALLTTSGTYEEWQRGAKMLNMEGMEMHAFGMMMGFGSPLMRFTTVAGITVCYTGESGAAKTGALRAACSIMGSPNGLELSGDKDSTATDNAFGQWMLSLKNIMMALDEASNRDAKNVSDLIYRVSAGKGKLRMVASVDSIREIPRQSCLINFMTSNQPMTGKLGSLKDNPDGELARLIEFYIYKPKLFNLRPGIAKEIFETLRLNYGWAGPLYVQHLFKVGDKYIQDLVTKWGIRFSKDYGTDSAYRFYEALVSVCFAGAELAAEAGIVAFDLERIYSTVIETLIKMRDGDAMTVNSRDYESVLGEFQNTFYGNTVLFKGKNMLRDVKVGKIVARLELDTQMFYVPRAEMRKYFQTRQIDEKDFVRHMEERGILAFKDRYRLISSTNPVSMYGFKREVSEDDYLSEGD